MHYYVDGYNLIFRTLSRGESLQQRRERLVAELSEKGEWLKLSITLVFDSQYQKSDSTRHHVKTVEIYYTDEYVTADDYIIRILKNHTSKERLTVVTSDLHLAWRARREGAMTLSCEDFIDMVMRRYKNKIQHVKKELSAPQVQKTNLPKLLSEPQPKKKKTSIPKQKSIEYYLEKFGSPEDKEREMKGQKSNPPSLSKEISEPPPSTYESDFDRWLRAFSREE